MGDIHRRGERRCSPREVAALAEGQHGLVTRAQLTLPATTVDSWVRAGRLWVVHRGVYAVGHRALSPEGRWLAAVLACGVGAVLSHLSAAVLWELIKADGELPDVTVPRSRRGQQAITVHRARQAPRSTTHRGIPVTTIAQTLIDLAATFTRPSLERALGEAELLPFFDEDALQRAIAENTNRRGVAKLKAVLAQHEAGTGIPRNVMERRFLKLCRAAGLPRPEVNQQLLGYEVDFLWRDLRVAVETDGRSIHARRAAFGRDRRRDRELQLAGYLVLRFTYAEVMYEPDMVTAGCCRACASGPGRAWSAASRTR